MSAALVGTPCRRICRQDGAAGFCLGCGRTVREVFLWRDLPEEERRRLLAELPRRLATLAASPEAVTEPARGST